MTNPPRTIADVIDRLDAIVARSRDVGSPLGLFAAMYRIVTQQVAIGIADGWFEDGPRMERFDVAFAVYYLDALARFEAGRRPSRAWAVAFAPSNDRIILQHLLLGMNAHINLDLALVASRAGEGLDVIKADFDAINDILAALIDPLQARVDAISPKMRLLDAIGGRSDEAIMTFSLHEARDQAWRNARILAALPEPLREGYVPLLDRSVATLGRVIDHPGPGFHAVLEEIRASEPEDVRVAIDALAEPLVLARNAS
jgi:hypothetical protein